MSPEQIILAGAVLGALVVIVTTGRRLASWWSEKRSGWRELIVAVRDTNLGRDAVHDSITGEETQPPVPSIGVRMARVEGAVVSTQELAEKSNELQAQGNELMQQVLDIIKGQQHQDTRLDDHEQRIVTLEEASDERKITRAESLTHLAMLARAQGLDFDELTFPPGTES